MKKAFCRVRRNASAIRKKFSAGPNKTWSPLSPFHPRPKAIFPPTLNDPKIRSARWGRDERRWRKISDFFRSYKEIEGNKLLRICKWNIFTAFYTLCCIIYLVRSCFPEKEFFSFSGWRGKRDKWEKLFIFTAFSFFTRKSDCALTGFRCSFDRPTDRQTRPIKATDTRNQYYYIGVLFIFAIGLFTIRRWPFFSLFFWTMKNVCVSITKNTFSAFEVKKIRSRTQKCRERNFFHLSSDVIEKKNLIGLENDRRIVLIGQDSYMQNVKYRPWLLSLKYIE